MAVTEFSSAVHRAHLSEGKKLKCSSPYLAAVSSAVELNGISFAAARVMVSYFHACQTPPVDQVLALIIHPLTVQSFVIRSVETGSGDN
jgi:hypothetical protein